MPKQKIFVKAKTDYLARFRETRQVGAYNFDLDLRKIKNDSQLTRSQKAQITQTHNEYNRIRARVKKGSLSLHKPRKHKNENNSQYKKRLRAIQKENNQSGSKLGYVVANAPVDASVTFNRKNQMIIKKKNSRLHERRFPVIDDLLHLMINDVDSGIKGAIALHNKEHPKKKAMLVGVAFNGHVKKMKSVKKVDELVDEIETFITKYNGTGDVDNIGSILTHIVVRY